MTKLKWLIYTVLIGLVPFFVRLFIFIAFKNLDPSYVINEIDMITFGLVLNISNITECDGNTSLDANAKTFNIGFSIFFIVVFAMFLGITYVSDIPGMDMFDKRSIKISSVVVSGIALCFSYSIFRRLD